MAVKYKQNDLGKHHMFELLQYNPQAIIFSALQNSNNKGQSLKTLYKQMTSTMSINKYNSNVGRVVTDALDSILQV
jgi:hypothetical protein